MSIHKRIALLGICNSESFCQSEGSSSRRLKSQKVGTSHLMCLFRAYAICVCLAATSTDFRAARDE